LETDLLIGNVLAVGFEAVNFRHASLDAAHLYGGFLAEVTALCEAKDIPYTGITPGVIKRAATGKGNSKKDKMIAAAKARWPSLDIVDDNMADALWVSECALVELKYDPSAW
jgi:Holliday junction resolvasome RuvABC endonuclease subunit